MSSDGNAPSTADGPLKQQEGTPLPFLDHNFKGYRNMEWFQWELNVQLQATGTTQLNSANNVRPKIKAFLVKLFAMHGKETSTCSLRIADAWKWKTFQIMPK
eukprot:9754852-Ditylum_brightwellii.AAC.1